MYGQFPRLGRGMGSHLGQGGSESLAKELGVGTKGKWTLWGGHRPEQKPLLRFIKILIPPQ